MVTPAKSKKPLPPLWHDIVKFAVVLAIFFLVLVPGAVGIASLMGLIPN